MTDSCLIVSKKRARIAFILVESVEAKSSEEFLVNCEKIDLFALNNFYVQHYKSERLKKESLAYPITNKSSTCCDNIRDQFDLRKIRRSQISDKFELFHWQIDVDFLSQFITTNYFNNDETTLNQFLSNMIDILNKYRKFFFTAFQCRLSLDEVTIFQPIFGLFLNELFKQLLDYGCCDMKYCDANSGPNMKLSRPLNVKNTSNVVRSVSVSGYTDLAIFNKYYEDEDVVVTNCHSIIELKPSFQSLFSSASFAQKDQLFLQTRTLSYMKLMEQFERNKTFKRKITIGGLTDAFSINLCLQEITSNKVYMSNHVTEARPYIMYLMLLCLDISDELFDTLKPNTEISIPIYDDDQLPDVVDQNNNMKAPNNPNNDNNSNNNNIKETNDSNNQNKENNTKKSSNFEEKEQKIKSNNNNMSYFDENIYLEDQFDYEYMDKINRLNEIMIRRNPLQSLTFEYLENLNNKNKSRGMKN